MLKLKVKIITEEVYVNEECLKGERLENLEKSVGLRKEEVEEKIDIYGKEGLEQYKEALKEKSFEGKVKIINKVLWQKRRFQEQNGEKMKICYAYQMPINEEDEKEKLEKEN